MRRLLTQRNFSLLWFAGLVSVAGDFALVVALPLFIYERTDSTLAIAGVFAARYLPSILLGSVAGVFVDRWDRRRTMVAADLLRALIALLLVVADARDALWLVFVVAALLGTVGLFFSPAENALLPLLVGPDDLVAANALNALNDNLGRLVGPAVGATLYAWSGLGAVAVVDAVTFVGSALLIRLIVAQSKVRPTKVLESGQTVFRRMLSEWHDGLALVRRSRALMVVFAGAALGSIAEGVFGTLGLAPFVLDVLGGGDAAVGWLSSAQAVGGLIAGMTVARFARDASKKRLLGLGMVGIGITDVSMFNARLFAGRGTPAVGFAIGCMFLAGFPAVALGTGAQSLLQELTHDEFRGRVFGALTAVTSVAVLIGLGASGVLGDLMRLTPILTVGAAMWLVGGAVVLALLPRHPGPEGAPSLTNGLARSSEEDATQPS